MGQKEALKGWEKKETFNRGFKRGFLYDSKKSYWFNRERKSK